MTYQELSVWISQLTEEQKQCDVSVFVSDMDEFFPLCGLLITTEDDVLDENHPYFVV